MFPLMLGRDLDFDGYQTALAGAAAAAHVSGMKKDEITKALQGLRRLSGRMKVQQLDSLTIFDSSNSGLKVRDVERALDRAKGKACRCGRGGCKKQYVKA